MKTLSRQKETNFLKNMDHCIPRVSGLESLRRILRICISNELPGDAKAAGLKTMLGELEEPLAFSSKQDKLFFSFLILSIYFNLKTLF